MKIIQEGVFLANKYNFQSEVSHPGLNKYRIVKAASRYELNQKVSALKNQWDAEWAKKIEREQKILEENAAIEYAKKLTEEAVEKNRAIENILTDSLIPVQLTADELKDFSKFTESKPTKPRLETIPIEPLITDRKYTHIPFFISLFAGLKQQREAKNASQFQKDHNTWEFRLERAKNANSANLKKYEEACEVWETRKNNFYQQQAEENSKIDLMFENIAKNDKDAIEQYVDLLLQSINHPFDYDKYSECEYNTENNILIVDITLPVIDDIPILKSVSYIKSKKEFKETYFPETAVKKMYDSVLYQIVLQTMNYIFDFGKKYSVIDAVVINGKIKTIDKSNGKSIEPYIISINYDKASFEDLNLDAIDPKVWFKNAKGVSASALSTITPIAPIIVMDKTDKRFVQEYSVMDSVSEGTNLAAMDWQDFENLIREIFEQEFSLNGGEVKITQASRDGGVDAVAFDPDPIRGGKIVIQAKRYTNVVGVSAVRDLYGTVMNEGATKGILVTTSNYGNDAYEFASGKPLTLLNGANLLSLIQKHGHKAYIDINEAKKFFKNN